MNEQQKQDIIEMLNLNNRRFRNAMERGDGESADRYADVEEHIEETLRILGWWPVFKFDEETETGEYVDVVEYKVGMF